MRESERAIQARSQAVMAAAQVLIGMVRMAEKHEEARAVSGSLSVEVELRGGGVEVWEIVVTRTASCH